MIPIQAFNQNQFEWIRDRVDLDWKLGLDWFRFIRIDALAWIQISEWIGIVLIGSGWISIQYFRQGCKTFFGLDRNETVLFGYKLRNDLKNVGLARNGFDSLSWQKYWIEIHPDPIKTIPIHSDIQVFNPYQSVSDWSRLNFQSESIRIIPTLDSFGLIRIEILVSDWFWLMFRN